MLFGFFHKDEKKELVKAVHKRKEKLLDSVKHLYADEKRITKLNHIERHILESVEKLDPKEKAAVDTVLHDSRSEEQIIDYLARIETEIQSLVESGDVEAIRKRLKKYIYTINQLKTRLEQLELSKKAQLARIAEEEKRLEKEAKSKAFGKTLKKREETRNALKLMRMSHKLETLENKAARKRFYRSLSQLGANSTKLLSELFRATSEAAKIAGNVGKMGTTGSAAFARKLDDALHK